MRALFALTLALLSGCLASKHMRTGPVLPPKPENCEIRVFLGGETVPGQYEVVGLVEAGPGPDLVTVVPYLQKEACLLGADAIVGIDAASGAVTRVSSNSAGQLSSTSSTHTRAVAKAVRLVPGTPPPCGPIVVGESR